MQGIWQTLCGKAQLYLDLIRFDRPAGWLLLLWPTLIALWLAADGWPSWHLLLVFTLGTVLMRSAGCCVNDVADADVDKHVKRTALRPVTSGRISKKEALAVGAALAVVAFLLVLTTRPALVGWSLLALLITVLYPFAKRRVSMPQAVLGVAFGVGIPMAFTAVHAMNVWPDAVAAWRSPDAWALSALWHGLPWQVWPLVLGNLCWVLAYDTEYAMVDRDDDLKVGIYTSAITLGRFDVAAVMGFYSLHVLLWAWAMFAALPLGVLAVAVLAVGVQIGWHYRLIHNRTRDGCFTAFKHNHWIGLTWFAAVAVGLALR